MNYKTLSFILLGILFLNLNLSQAQDTDLIVDDLDSAINECIADFYAADAYWNNYWSEGDDSYSNEDDWDYSEYCDDECLTAMDEFELFLEDLDQPFQPCYDLEYDLELMAGTDTVSVDLLNDFYFCYMEKYYLADYPLYTLYYCVAQIADYYRLENQSDIIYYDDVSSCEMDCETSIGCGSDCLVEIDDIWDSTLESCTFASQMQAQDFTDGYTSNSDDFTYQAAQEYQYCIWDQQWNSYDDLEIDWDYLYEFYDYYNGEFDFTDADLSVEELSYLTLDCYTTCYYNDSNYVFYDNEFAYEEWYGEDYWDYYGEEYDYGFYEDDDDYYDDYGCDGDECFDNEGYYTGSNTTCKNNYCYQEFFYCIEDCTQKYCPADTCYDDTQDLATIVEERCINLKNVTNKLIENNAISSTQIVPVIYLDAFNGCVDILIKTNEDSGNFNTYQEQLYSCYQVCTDEKQSDPNTTKNSGFILEFALISVISLFLLF